MKNLENKLLKLTNEFLLTNNLMKLADLLILIESTLKKEGFPIKEYRDAKK